MRVVVDTNILMNCLISLRNEERESLLNSEIEFIAPNFLFVELFRHKEKLLAQSKLNEEQIQEYLHRLLDGIEFYQLDLISQKNRQKAYDLCKGIDIKDTIYVALCLELDARLWTKDNKLKRHLIKLGFNRFYQP